MEPARGLKPGGPRIRCCMFGSYYLCKALLLHVRSHSGMHCQHLQCFELEAFLITAAAMPFQRRLDLFAVISTTRPDQCLQFWKGQAEQLPNPLL